MVSTLCHESGTPSVSKIAAGLKGCRREDAEAGGRVVRVVWTVDPARDTPAVLRQFVGAFHPRMIGLTGPAPAIDAVAKAYGIYHAIGERQPGGGYLVDHSRQAYLMDPAGRPIALVPAEKSPEAVAATLAAWVR